MYINKLGKIEEKHSVVYPPPASLVVPKNVEKFGEQNREMSDIEQIQMLRDALGDAISEVSQLRTFMQQMAAMLQQLALMSKRGEDPLVIDEDGTLLLPYFTPQDQARWTGKLNVVQGMDGWELSFNDR